MPHIETKDGASNNPDVRIKQELAKAYVELTKDGEFRSAGETMDSILLMAAKNMLLAGIKENVVQNAISHNIPQDIRLMAGKIMGNIKKDKDFQTRLEQAQGKGR